MSALRDFLMEYDDPHKGLVAPIRVQRMVEAETAEQAAALLKHCFPQAENIRWSGVMSAPRMDKAGVAS